jgi:hypothetical protein
MKNCLFAIAAVGMIAACGSSASQTACTNYINAYNKLITDEQPCLGDAGGSIMPIPTSYCGGANNFSSACNTSLNNVSTCLNNLPACNPASDGGISGWSAQVDSCVTSNPVACP